MKKQNFIEAVIRKAAELTSETMSAFGLYEPEMPEKLIKSDVEK